MSALQNRLYFVGQYMSKATVSRLTDIPYRRILTAWNNPEKLTASQQKSVLGLYGKTLYALFRDNGLSAANANLQRSLAPDTARERLQLMQDKLDFLTQGVLTRKLKTSLLDMNNAQTSQLYNQYYQQIKKSIAENQTTYSEFTADKY